MLADASIFAVDGDTLTLSNDSDTVLATFTGGLTAALSRYGTRDVGGGPVFVGAAASSLRDRSGDDLGLGGRVLGVVDLARGVQVGELRQLRGRVGAAGGVADVLLHRLLVASASP